MSREHAPAGTPPLPRAQRDEDAPAFHPPQLATLVKAAPRGEGWLHELKLDGYRLILVGDGEDVELYSRNHKRWTERLPHVADAARALGHRAVIDGEAVLFDEQGRPSFADLVEGVHHGRRDEVVLMAFDLLWLDGWDLRPCPLVERKAQLKEVLMAAGSSRLSYLEHVEGDGERVFSAACSAGAEGIVSKRARAPYLSGRDRSWQKRKCTARQELVIAGFTPPGRPEDHLGALVLGFYDDGALRYAGKVGTGFSREQRRRLRERLERLERETSPFDDVPKGLRATRWAAPRLVAEIEFSEWTRAGVVRHPSFLGLREDKAPEQVVRERPGG